MPTDNDISEAKADNRHESLESLTSAMEAEATAQANELPPNPKPVAPKPTLIPQSARPSGSINFG